MFKETVVFTMINVKSKIQNYYRFRTWSQVWFIGDQETLVGSVNQIREPIRNVIRYEIIVHLWNRL